MTIKKKNARLSSVYNRLFDAYEQSGPHDAVSLAETLTKGGEITKCEARSLLEEIEMCFDIG